MGRRTLLIDADPQGNATTGLGMSAAAGSISTYEVIEGSKPLQKAHRCTSIPGLDLVPSTVDLMGAEIELVDSERREYRLLDAVQAAPTDHDYILIDCPPALGFLTLNALTASQTVLIPLQCEFFALQGLTQLVRTLQRVRRVFNPSLGIEGVVLTMYDKRNKLSAQVAEDVRNCMGSKVYETIIPRNVRMSEAPSHGKPALIYDRHCAGSTAYMALAREVLRRETLAAA